MSNTQERTIQNEIKQINKEIHLLQYFTADFRKTTKVRMNFKMG